MISLPRPRPSPPHHPHHHPPHHCCDQLPSASMPGALTSARVALPSLQKALFPMYNVPNVQCSQSTMYNGLISPLYKKHHPIPFQASHYQINCPNLHTQFVTSHSERLQIFEMQPILSFLYGYEKWQKKEHETEEMNPAKPWLEGKWEEENQQISRLISTTWQEQGEPQQGSLLVQKTGCMLLLLREHLSHL